MTLNYAFGFSVILLLLVAVNVYFFYTFTGLSKPHSFPVPSKLELAPDIFKDIFDQLNYLPSHYKVKNPKYLPVQRRLLQSFQVPSDTNTRSLWQDAQKWSNEETLFPRTYGAPGQILHAIRTSPIALVDNAPKGSIYAGFDRHNSEVFAYYLASVLNFKWIAPSTIRKVHVRNDVVPFATAGLKMTMLKNESGSHCIYGKCYYCKPNETVCPDNNGEIEGAAILYLDKQFGIHKYEVYKDKIVLVDNGKGLGNPAVDEMDILAPLYQCCILSLSTWLQLEMVPGGSLTDTIKLISATQGETLATEEHFRAVERRLLKIYATVQYCIGKHGRAKVLKSTF
ncbi:Glycosaminoglycan xylosylkinase [Operophtera brumata]|uniref:Glycosaminoglycan xylosylkinase n=1 Tax=Operophtera brumata TaxID=104452 RepID=A0A0L7KWC8_OPEBR|nr:Glycosaminoglycan xylosylkinase [Operophtera brumata]